MALKYALYKNLLTPELTYAARIQELQTKSIEEVVTQLTREGSILKETECNAVLTAFFEQLAKNIKEGIGFQSPYISISPSVRGVFKDEEDRFTEDVHEKTINISTGVFLRRITEEIKLEKVKPSVSPQPVLIGLIDIVSDTTNEKLSKGGVIEIKGERLKIDEAAADEGIFLLNKANANEVKISRIHQNLPGTLQCVIPASVINGTYTVEVRNRLYRTVELRKGQLPFDITVA